MSTPIDTRKSVIDQFIENDEVDAYYLTDDLVITAPTYAQAKAFDNAEKFNNKLDAWLGEDIRLKFEAALDELPVHLVEKVLLHFMNHFFGAEAAKHLAAMGEAARSQALAEAYTK